MDDLNEKLSALLNDPEGMNRIKSMAENLLGSKAEEPQKNAADDFDIDIGALTGILKKMKGNGVTDSRINLLLALKPNLLEATCCNVEVVKGKGLFLFFFF